MKRTILTVIFVLTIISSISAKADWNNSFSMQKILVNRPTTVVDSDLQLIDIRLDRSNVAHSRSDR